MRKSFILKTTFISAKCTGNSSNVLFFLLFVYYNVKIKNIKLIKKWKEPYLEFTLSKLVENTKAWWANNHDIG